MPWRSKCLERLIWFYLIFENESKRGCNVEHIGKIQLSNLREARLMRFF